MCILCDILERSHCTGREVNLMGNRMTRAATHLPEDTVKARMQGEQRLWRRHRWEIIYQALTAPRKAEDSARTVGVSLSTVHRVIATYKQAGVAAIETDGERRTASPAPHARARTRLPPAVHGPRRPRGDGDGSRNPAGL